MNVLVILGVLFLALIIIVPLIEKSGMRVSNEASSKMARIILPLIIIAMVIQLLFYLF
ncbi:hypothetical protein ACFO4O_05995 [Glaciecola siphonariae]|uniref:Uncharacterized protein n=1 Tax=Glaciecola siphonariae TaxID=521012 RepID=A0ABV9LUL6_9ALTE